MTLSKTVPGPRTFPFIGNWHLYKLGKYNYEKYHEVLCSLYKEYGPLVREQLGPLEIIHVFEPDDVEKIHSKEGPTPYVHPLQATVQQYRKMRKTSPGLGNTNGEEWLRLRSAVRQVVLRPQNVQTFLPDFNEIANDFIGRMKQRLQPDGQIADLRKELSKWSMEASGWTSFGLRLRNFSGGSDERSIEQLIEANRIVFKESMILKFSLQLYKHIPTPSWRRLLAAENIIYRIQEELIARAFLKLETDQGVDCRVLKYLLSREELSFDDVTVLLLSFFTDSLSTTVPTLMSNLYCIAAHPDIQEEIYSEIKEAASDGQVTAENLQAIPLLKACVKEVFRMYPNGTETDRILQSDHQLAGHHLPAGTHVTTNQIVHFRSEKYFERPDKFLPHRWLRGGPSVHNYLLLPFGYGSRSCAGRRIAEQDLYVSIFKILFNFRLSVPKNQPLELIYETLLAPKEPLGVRFHPR